MYFRPIYSIWGAVPLVVGFMTMAFGLTGFIISSIIGILLIRFFWDTKFN